MKKSRRQFLKVASLSFLGLASSNLFPGAAAAAPEPGKAGYELPENALRARQWGMVIDTREFTSPEKFAAVINACHREHNVPDMGGKQEVKWIWKDDYHATFTDQMDNYPAAAVLDREYLMLCNHCENPPCTRVCPTKATFRRESDGIVVMDYHRCIGCRYCMAGCPFGARSFNFRDPRPFIEETNPAFPTRMKGVVEKCTFCSELLAKGELPRCVEASEGAILFGDLADPASEVRQALAENFTIRRKPTLGTSPSVYYII